MSLFGKGDCVVDQHGERLIVVEKPRLCQMTGKWQYTLVPDSEFSLSRLEDELTLCENFQNKPTDQQVLANMFQVLGAAAPALTAHPETATTFIDAVKALQGE